MADNFNILSRLGEDIENIDQALQRLATQIVDEMRARVPVRDGYLKKSIQFTMDRYGFQLSMLDYGAYQNFGVNGKTGSTDTIPTDLAFNIGAYGVEPGTEFAFGAKSSPSRLGINRQTFFSLTDYQERLKQLVENQIEELT